MSNERLPAVEFRNISRGWGNYSHLCSLVIEDEEVVVGRNATYDGEFNENTRDDGRGLLVESEDRSVAQTQYSTVDRGQDIANPVVDNILETPYPFPIPVNSPRAYDNAANVAPSSYGNFDDRDEWLPEDNASPAPFQSDDMTACDNPTKAARKRRTYFSGNIGDQILFLYECYVCQFPKATIIKISEAIYEHYFKERPEYAFLNIILTL